MNRQETASMLALVAAIHPNMAITDQVIDGWTLLLGDVEPMPAMHAMRRLLNSTDRYPTPASLRREVAAGAGTLAPTRGEAWEIVRARIARPSDEPIHHAIAEAADQIGWFDLRNSRNLDTIRSQFWRVYDDVAAKHDTKVTTVSGLLTHLPARRAEPALEAPAPPPPAPSAPATPEGRERALKSIREHFAKFTRRTDINEESA